jgi:hypothetical protein
MRHGNHRCKFRRGSEAILIKANFIHTPLIHVSNSQGLEVNFIFPMPDLRNLPTELLLWVYQSPDDIDDVLHLARSCRRLYMAFDDPKNRQEILKSIIVRSRALYGLKRAPPSSTDYVSVVIAKILSPQIRPPTFLSNSTLHRLCGGLCSWDSPKQLPTP